MKSAIVKRSVVIAGHKTSVSLEEPFWKGLKQIAERRHVRLCDLVTSVDLQRQHANLSSAIRLYVLDQLHGQLNGAVDAPTMTREQTPPVSSAA